MEYRKPINGEVIASISKRTINRCNVIFFLLSIVVLIITYQGLITANKVMNYQLNICNGTYEDYCYYKDFFGYPDVSELQFRELMNSRECEEMSYVFNKGIVSIIVRCVLCGLILYLIIYRLVIRYFISKIIVKYLLFIGSKSIVFKESGNAFEDLAGNRYILLYSKDVIYLGENRINIGYYDFDVAAPFNSDMPVFVEFLRTQVAFDLMMAAGEK